MMTQIEMPKIAPKVLASIIAQDLQTTLLRRTGFEFEVRQVQTLAPNKAASHAYVDLSNPDYKSAMDNSQSIKLGGFIFTPSKNVIRVHVDPSYGDSCGVSIIADGHFLPQKTVFFGLLQKSIDRKVRSSIRAVLDKTRKEQGITFMNYGKCAKDHSN